MTTWLELHQEMPRHKKLLVLARLLKVDRRYAVGIMIDLWTWSLDNADSDGNLSGMTADDIEMALDWPVKKSGELIAALLKAKLLEDRGGTYALHDWADYTGKLSERREIKREQDRKRQEKRRQKKCDTGEKKSVTNEECHAPVTRDITQVSHKNRGDYPTVPDRTVPDLVLKDLDLKQEPLCPKVLTADAGDFEEVQKAFSGKVSRSRLHWMNAAWQNCWQSTEKPPCWRPLTKPVPGGDIPCSMSKRCWKTAGRSRERHRPGKQQRICQTRSVTRNLRKEVCHSDSRGSQKNIAKRV